MFTLNAPSSLLCAAILLTLGVSCACTDSSRQSDQILNPSDKSVLVSLETWTRDCERLSEEEPVPVQGTIEFQAKLKGLSDAASNHPKAMASRQRLDKCIEALRSRLQIPIR
jgi:hypothetical protein